MLGSPCNLVVPSTSGTQVLCAARRTHGASLHDSSMQAPLYKQLQALCHSRRVQVVTEQVAISTNDSSSDADAQTGFSAHWLALLRAVQDVAAPRDRLSKPTTERASTEQANGCEVLLDVHESDLWRATRPSGGNLAWPPAQEQDMQVLELLCVATSDFLKHLKWLVGAGMWPGIRIAVVAMRLLAKLASKFLAAARGSIRWRGAVKHIARNAAPMVLS